MKKALIITTCLVLLAGSLAAQDWKGKGRVLGVVLDEADAPLEGVKVKVINVSANAGFEVMTDANGKFTAAWLRKGAWNIDFEKIGYEVKKIAIDVVETAKNPELKINLKKMAGLAVTDDVKNELIAANALFDQKDYQGALAGYTAILEKSPGAYIIYKNVGNCYFSLEQYEKAEEAYLKVLEKDAANADAMLLIGNTYANRNMPEKALEWYNKIELDKITDSTVLYNIGLRYDGIGKSDEALKYFKQAVAVNPKDLDALYQLGLAYVKTVNNPEAVATFELYLKIDPDSDRAAQVKGFLDYLKKK